MLVVAGLGEGAAFVVAATETAREEGHGGWVEGGAPGHGWECRGGQQGGWGSLVSKRVARGGLD